MKKSLWLIGLIQALGVAVYCALVAGFVDLMSRTEIMMPRFWGTAFMLVLLVFSAAATGLIVFGYPVLLFLKSRVKEGLVLLGYTLLFCLVVLMFILIIMNFYV